MYYKVIQLYNAWQDFKCILAARKQVSTPSYDANQEIRYRRAYEKAKDDIENWPHV